MVSLKEKITHTLAIFIILAYVFLLVKSGFDSTIHIPDTLSTIALLVLGYYFGTFQRSDTS